IAKILCLTGLPVDHGIARVTKTLAATFGDIDGWMGQVRLFRIPQSMNTQLESGAFSKIDFRLSQAGLYGHRRCPCDGPQKKAETQAASEEEDGLRPAAGSQLPSHSIALFSHSTFPAHTGLPAYTHRPTTALPPWPAPRPAQCNG